MPVRVSIWIARLWQIGWANLPGFWNHWPRPLQNGPKGGTSLFADDTPLKMLAPGNKKTRTARIRAYVRDERPWSGPCATGAQTDNLSSCAGRAPPCVWYQFTVDRKGEHPVKHLSGYQGWVHADGYAGFNGVFGEGKATEVACMAPHPTQVCRCVCRTRFRHCRGGHQADCAIVWCGKTGKGPISRGPCCSASRKCKAHLR